MVMKKLMEARSQLNAALFERDAETDGILMAMLSGSNCFFFGPPGTAKTRHINSAAKAFGLTTFDILLSESTKPDTVFGPVDVPALANGKQIFKTEGYAPASEILFFDEIFKASAIVLNPLLWLINEHEFRNGDNGKIKCPTVAVFAASNEIPSDPGLAAIYDRFLLRYNVPYLQDPASKKAMVKHFLGGNKTVEKPILSREDLKALRAMTAKVEVPDEVIDGLFYLQSQVQVALQISISDRRINGITKLIQAHAVLAGRKKATLADLEVCQHVMWHHPDQIPKIAAIVAAKVGGENRDAGSFMELAKSVVDNAIITGNLKEGFQKLRGLYSQLGSDSNSLIAKRDIKAKAHSLSSLQSSRTNFICTVIEEPKRTWVKLSPATAQVWTTDQIRSVGFHFRRKLGYWYTNDDPAKLTGKVKRSLGVECKFSTIKSDSDTQRKKDESRTKKSAKNK